MGMPRASCIMLTYGRYGGPQQDHTSLLNEAVMSFLKQDYQNKELVILNDTPGQTIEFDHPGVVVINAMRRFNTLGEKRNAAIEATTGNFIFVWDDDDIMLPWRLTQGVRWFESLDLDYCGSENFWYSEENKRYKADRAPHHGVMCSAAYRRAAVRQVSYRDMNTGEDQALVRDMQKAGLFVGCGAAPQEEAAVVYRWNYLARHVSGYSGDSGYAALGKDVYPPCTIQLRPRWYRNYIAATRKALRPR